MAALLGTYVDSPIWGTNDYITPEIDGLTGLHWPAAHNETEQPGGYSALTDNLPVTPVTRAISGHMAHSYVLDFYYHIHIVPNPVRLGYVAVTTYETVEVWNAFLDRPELLSEIIETDAEGVNLLDQPDPPTTFAINESRVYRVQAGPDGSPVIAAQFQFNFADEQPVLLITGSRSIVMEFPHNWRAPVMDEFERKTDVIINKDGTEQRIQLQKFPRRWVEYLYTVQGTQKQRLKNKLWVAQDRPTIIPLFIDPCLLTQGASVNDTELNVDSTSLKSFLYGGMGIIISGSKSEVFQIDSFIGDRIDLDSGLDRSWPAGSLVYPARVARVAAEQSAPALSPRVSELTVQYEVIGEQEIGGPPAYDLYDGTTVSVYRPNWRESVDLKFTREMLRSDNGVAAPILEDYHDQQSTMTKQSYTAFSRLDTRRLAGFVYLNNVKFSRYEPSWESDITVLDYISPTDVVIKIANAGHQQMSGQPGREHVAFFFSDGTREYRGISNLAESDADTELLTIDSALGTERHVSEILQVCYMQKARSASSRVQMAWHNPEVMEVTTTIKGIPKE